MIIIIVYYNNHYKQLLNKHKMVKLLIKDYNIHTLHEILNLQL